MEVAQQRSHAGSRTSSNLTYSNGDLTILCGEAANVAFSGTPYSPRVANLRMSYAPGVQGKQATVSTYGSGCLALGASFYELFAPATQFDLNNSRMRMSRTSPGYSLSVGGTFVPPSGGAVVLALGDDTDVATPTLSIPFPYDGGAAATLRVCSNGFVSVASGNGTSFSPNVSWMLNAPQTAWWCWHDFDPSITTVGAGRVTFQETSGIAYITWNGVWDYGGTSAANASTFQFQFNLNTGSVTLVWGTMSTLGNPFLVGYSPGGASADPSPRDLSVALPAGFPVAGADQFLTLSMSQRPIPANTVSFLTGNNNPSTIFGAVLLGLTSYPAGISLAPQMPGCFRYNDALATTPLFFGGAPVQSTSFLVPNALGINLYAQSMIYCPAAGLNPLGAVSSNGLDLRIGSY